jgi:hypothetical protein
LRGREALPAQPENRFSARSGIGFVDGRQYVMGSVPAEGEMTLSVSSVSLHDVSDGILADTELACDPAIAASSALIATTLGKVGLILVALRPDDQASYHVPSQQQA